VRTFVKPKSGLKSEIPFLNHFLINGPTSWRVRTVNTLVGITNDYFLRNSSQLATTPSTARTTVDIPVNSDAACPEGPYFLFGGWSLNLQ